MLTHTGSAEFTPHEVPGLQPGNVIHPAGALRKAPRGYCHALPGLQFDGFTKHAPPQDISRKPIGFDSIVLASQSASLHSFSAPAPL